LAVDNLVVDVWQGPASGSDMAALYPKLSVDDVLSPAEDGTSQ
jgi:hypothetical protein